LSSFEAGNLQFVFVQFFIEKVKHVETSPSVAFLIARPSHGSRHVEESVSPALSNLFCRGNFYRRRGLHQETLKQGLKFIEHY